MYNELGKNSSLFRKAQSESDSYSHKIEADSAGNDDVCWKFYFVGKSYVWETFLSQQDSDRVFEWESWIAEELHAVAADFLSSEIRGVRHENQKNHAEMDREIPILSII